MKQQFAHLKVIPKIKSLHLMYKKLKSFLNRGMVHAMSHTYRI